MNHPASQAGNAQRVIDVFAMVEGDGESLVSFGTRLRRAREARGQSLEQCAHALKLPGRVLAKLEADDHAGIDHAVYLAGYIDKYGHHLGLDPSEIQAELERVKRVAPVLVATGGIPRSRYLLERYATAATYVVLTAVIVVPMIWLGVRGTLDRDLSHLAPLDAAPVAQQDAAGSATAKHPASAPARPVDGTDQQPLLASMAPFPNLEGRLAAAKPASAAGAAAGNPAAAAASAAGHELGLDLSGPSWVEVTTADGQRLEYSLLPAGAHKDYSSAQPLDVRIGNAGNATVSVDGQALTLAQFRHGDVAHFRVDEGKATVGDR